MRNTEYRRGGHTKYSLRVHLIFVTKYRHKIFKDEDMILSLKAAMNQAALLKNCSIHIMETDIDHIHLLIEHPPFLSISALAAFLKQYSTHRMWQDYSPVLRRFYWKKKILWSDGYFACSIGDASAATIEQYIANQG